MSINKPFHSYLPADAWTVVGDTFKDDWIPLDIARRGALRVLFLIAVGALTVPCEYVVQKIDRVFHATQWWHCMQMLHPSMHREFIAECQRLQSLTDVR